MDSLFRKIVGWFRKEKKPQTEAEILADALASVKGDQARKARIRRKKYRRWWPEWLDRRVIMGLLVVVCAIIGDGVRRENQEFYANVTRVYGTVQVQSDVGQSGRQLAVGDQLENRNIVRTGQSSGAVLEFPDGSLVAVGANSHMVVKMLEYSRGGAWRGRSFFVKAGQIWVRISPRSGERSEMRVYTPSSVAAVRGTTFSVYQSRQGDQSSIQCSTGSVEAQGFRGRPQIVSANTRMSVALGQPPERAESLTVQQRRYFGQSDLTKPIPPEHWLKTFELTLTQLLDAPLTILGLGKSSWGAGSADFARRAATRRGLNLLHQHLEGSPTYPEFVNPATIEQLGIPREHRRRILSVFHGDALEMYRQLAGGRGFIIFARSRDKERTLFKLTPYGSQTAKAGELQRYW